MYRIFWCFVAVQLSLSSRVYSYSISFIFCRFCEIFKVFLQYLFCIVLDVFTQSRDYNLSLVASVGVGVRYLVVGQQLYYKATC